MAGPSLAIRSQVPNATVDNDGLMTKEQVVQLNNASGGGITLPLNEDLTFTEGDKAIEIAASTTGDGGNLTLNAADAGAEANNDGGSINLNPGLGGGIGPDGSVKVANGAITLENQPDFGAPHVYGDADGLYVSADGVGAVRGGTGVAMVQDSITPANSFVGLNVNDENIAVVTDAGVLPVPEVSPTKTLGAIGQPWLAAYARTLHPGNAANLNLSAPAGQKLLLSPNGNTYFEAGDSLFGPTGNNQSILGSDTFRWGGVFAYYFDTKQGTDVVAASTITPTAGLVVVSGATTINTIATTAFNTSGFGVANPRFTLVASGGTITWSAAGNILAAGTVGAGLAQDFQWVSSLSKWAPVN